MIRVTQNSRHSQAEELSSAYHYEIAGQALAFQSQVSKLAAFEQGPATDQFSELLRHSQDVELLSAQNAKLKYSGQAHLDGAFRQVDYWRKRSMAQIDVDGEAACSIDLQEGHIHLLNQGSFDAKLNLELVTGPALVVLLAQNGVYCLHAGAVSLAAGNVAMVAESGSGKSTLSAHVDEQWRQISDDILPLRLSEDETQVEMLTNFPQLKLEDAITVEASSEAKALDHILRLNPAESRQITFQAVDRTQRLLQIVRHTVGARLFDKRAMRRHAKFAKKLSGLVAMTEVSYPRKLEMLPELRQQIRAYLTKPPQ